MPMPVGAPEGFSLLRSADAPPWATFGVHGIADTLHLLREALQDTPYRVAIDLLQTVPINPVPPQLRVPALLDTLHHRLMLASMQDPFERIGAILHEVDHGAHDRAPAVTLEERTAREKRAHSNTVGVLNRVRGWLERREEKNELLKAVWLAGIAIPTHAQEFGLAEWRAFKEIVVPLNSIAQALSKRSDGVPFHEILARTHAIGTEFLAVDAPGAPSRMPSLLAALPPLLDMVRPLTQENQVLGARLTFWDNEVKALASAWSALTNAGRRAVKALDDYEQGSAV